MLLRIVANRIVAIIQASYPVLWAYTGFLYLFGAMVALKIGFVGNVAVFVWYGLWITIGASLFGYLLNDLFDRSVDIHNPRKKVRALTVAEHVLGIAFALVSFTLIEFFYPNGFMGILVGIALCSNMLYSIPPIRLKRVPILDTLNGPASFFVPMLCGYTLITGSWPPWLTLLAGFLFFIAIDIAFKTLDIEADRASRITTIAVTFGRKWALAVCVLLLIGSALTIGAVDSRFALAPLLYLSVLPLFACATNTDTRTRLDAALPLLYMFLGFIVTFLHFVFV